MTTDYGEEMEAYYYLPRIRHRLGLSYAALGEEKAARANFEESMRLFEANNLIGRARVSRDYGWWLTDSLHEVTVGQEHLQQALSLLENEAEALRCERWYREHLVTRGVIARLSTGTSPEETKAILLEVNKYLRGGDKWAYELDNLRHLIPLLSLRERPSYIARATFIEARIALHEDIAVLASDLRDGKLVRGCGYTALRVSRRFLPL
jgi:hypothetical protein